MIEMINYIESLMSDIEKGLFADLDDLYGRISWDLVEINNSIKGEE